MPSALTQTLTLPTALRLDLTLAGRRMGRGDPTFRVEPGRWSLAWRTSSGPAALQLVQRGAALSASAWGEGREHAMAQLPRYLGFEDAPEALELDHPLLRRYQRQHRGLRLGVHPVRFDMALCTVIQQRISYPDAVRSFRIITRLCSEPAPGPLQLLLPADPKRVRRLAATDFQYAGIDLHRRRALVEVATIAPRLERAAQADEVERLLSTVRGVGGWTIGRVRGFGFGEPDALLLGDYHLPHVISEIFTGAPRGNDELMMRLLEPFRGQRFRLQHLLLHANSRVTRVRSRGQRTPIRQVLYGQSRYATGRMTSSHATLLGTPWRR